MRVAIHQFTPEFGERDANRGRLVDAIEAASREEPFDLAVLPELAITGYRFRDRTEIDALAETVPGPTTDALTVFARAHDAHVVVGIARRDGERRTNAAVVVGPSGVVAIYDKVHLFGIERDMFDPGRDPWPIVEVAGARVGVMVCFDWCFPEAARSLALRGADLIAMPSNLVLPHAQRAMETRCLENRVFAALANRGGVDAREGLEPLRFTGRSRLIGPDGEVLIDVADDADTVRTATIDPTLARSKRVASGNDLFADRRPDLYGDLIAPVSRKAAP